MPTYQYRCKDCDADLEVVQKFTDNALTDCPSCDDGELRKVFNAVGVVFKGSGFYRTDSRAKDSAGAGSSSAAAGAGENKKEPAQKEPAKKQPAKAAASTASASSD